MEAMEVAHDGPRFGRIDGIQRFQRLQAERPEAANGTEPPVDEHLRRAVGRILHPNGSFPRRDPNSAPAHQGFRAGRFADPNPLKVIGRVLLVAEHRGHGDSPYRHRDLHGWQRIST
jgi:hypothetical protein